VPDYVAAHSIADLNANKAAFRAVSSVSTPVPA
jgi:hypothetical protein